MVISNTSTASLLSSIYSDNASSLASSMSKIASGKRVQNPGDDFAAYVRAAGLNNDIATQNSNIQDLTNAKGAVDFAVGVGNNVLSDLQNLSDLQTQYTAAAGDAQKQAAFSAQYDAIVNRIAGETSNGSAAYDTIANVYNTTAFGISAGGLTIQATNAATPANVTAGGIATDTVGTEITAAQSYVADMTSFQTEISRQTKLAGTVIADKQATVNALINVDDLQESSNVTNMQVRQQAAVSMMSQANISQAALAKLFG